MKPWRILALTLIAVIGLAACSSSDDPERSGGPLPEAGPLLERAARTTSEITSAHLTLRVEGELPNLRVTNLDGDLTRADGEVAAKGTGKMRASGQLVSVEFVLTGGTLYLKGPTGGFQEIPAALSSSVYDPSAVLDPERGVSKILRSVSAAETTGREEVSGTPTVTVTGTVPADALSGLLPGISGEPEVTFWLADEQGNRPVKARVRLPNDSGDAPTVFVTLSEVNEPVTVRPPS